MAIPRPRADRVQAEGDLLSDARDAWADGKYRSVSRMLERRSFPKGTQRVEAALLRARALLVLNEPQAVASVLDLDPRDLSRADDDATARMLRAAAATRIGRCEAGDRSLDELAQQSDLPPTIATEVAYYRALSRWSSYRLDDAEAIIEGQIERAEGVIRSRLMQLRGWIDIRRENYAAAAHQFSAALDTLRSAPRKDPKGSAAILHALAFIAAETIDLQLGLRVRREYTAEAWTSDTRIEQFQVLEQLSWLSLLEGDVQHAWQERQHALSLSVDSTYHALALMQAGEVARIVGDGFSAERYIALAGKLLLAGDQTDLDVERRIALLTFVAGADDVHGPAAASVLTLYERSLPKDTRMLAFEDGDRRVEAYYRYASGKQALRTGNRERAIAQLHDSLERWVQLTYRLRAAIVANELFQLTGEEAYARTALEALRRAPKAWLHASLGASERDDPVRSLTPAERRVLVELCRGKRAREIASDLGRSYNTVNNHTKRVFSAFGVNSRAALVAECARRGILRPPPE